MIRRSALLAVALVLTASAAPAFAGSLIDTQAPASGSYGLCLLGSNHSTGVQDGICVWIPTK